MGIAAVSTPFTRRALAENVDFQTLFSFSRSMTTWSMTPTSASDLTCIVDASHRGGVARRVDAATGAFNRLMAKQGGPGVGGAHRNLDAKLAELDKWTRNNRVEERLAALRAQRGQGLTAMHLGGFLLAGANVPFVAALVLMLLVGIAEATGLGGGLAMDADVDGAPDGPSLLAWLNVGHLPFLMLLVVFLFTFGISGLVGQRLVQAITGHLLPHWVAAPLALLPALPATRVFGRLFCASCPAMRPPPSAVRA